MVCGQGGSGKFSRTGFTLVELLVVIAIIGTLVGLLLPAVQQARESARRSACTNKIKQLALAVLNFESARDKLPPASANNELPTTSGGRGDLASWIVFALPFCEEQSLYESCVTNFRNGGAPWDGSSTSPFVKQITGLVCPSDQNARPSTAVTSGYGVTNYRGSKGDMWGQWNNGIRGPFSDARLAGDNTKYVPVRSKNITDGISKTILLGEAVVGTLTNNVKSGLAVSVGILPDTPPSTCSARRSSDGLTLTGATASTVGQGLGHRWGDCRDVYTYLYTKIPPNGVSCADTTPESTAAVAASSWHPGGVNMAMCDGTVKFFADTIDAGDATAVPTWPSGAIISYASPYGVWGALGSIAGGERNANAD